MSLARALQELTPNSPYAVLLSEQFGVEVPESAPMYQKEFLYKYCLQEKFRGTEPDVIVALAAVKVNEYIAKNPWSLLKYEDMVAETTKAPRKTKKVEYADGTLVYNERPGTHHGVYFYMLGGKIAARGMKLEKLYALIAKKIGPDAYINKENIVTI